MVEKEATFLREVQIKLKKKKMKVESPVGDKVTDSEQVYRLFKELEDEAKEKFITISLDSHLKIICFEVVAVGSSEAIYLKPFEAIRTVIPWSPHGFIVVHNHPSGDPTPSEADITFTKNLKVITDAGGAKLMDHIIIGEDGYFSFIDEGLL